MRSLSILIMSACSLGGPSVETGVGSASPIAHLIGCWASVGPEGDRWSVAYASPAPGVVLGTTRHLRTDGTVSEERERFEIGPDGLLGVVSELDGERRDRFVLDPARSGEGGAVFTRQGSGWPGWLGYARSGESLKLELGGEGRVVQMELGKVDCG